MSKQIEVSLTGFLGGDPVRRVLSEEASYARLRVACTPRRWDSGEQAYRDGETQWVTVRAWDELGENVAASLRKGNPVIVRGTLRTDTWDGPDGESRQETYVRADAIGPDLRRGTASFVRTIRGPAGEGGTSTDVTAPAGDLWQTRGEAQPEEEAEAPAAV